MGKPLSSSNCSLMIFLDNKYSYNAVFFQHTKFLLAVDLCYTTLNLSLESSRYLGPTDCLTTSSRVPLQTLRATQLSMNSPCLMEPVGSLILEFSQQLFNGLCPEADQSIAQQLHSIFTNGIFPCMPRSSK